MGKSGHRHKQFTEKSIQMMLNICKHVHSFIRTNKENKICNYIEIPCFAYQTGKTHKVWQHTLESRDSLKTKKTMYVYVCICQKHILEGQNKTHWKALNRKTEATEPKWILNW